MAIFQEKAVITGNGIVVWDGITNPERKDDGTIIHSLKVAFDPGQPEIAEIHQIATSVLNEGQFRGNLPPGGHWPVNNCDGIKIEGKLAGKVEINPKSRKGAPQVFDANGQLLDPMQYNAMLYPGAIVQVLVHAFDFNQKTKGVGLGLDGVKIIDATAPRLPVGGGFDAGAAFGAGGPPPQTQGAMPPGPPQPQTYPPPHNAILQPEPKVTIQGKEYTVQQLKAAGWTDHQIRVATMADDIPF